MLRRTQKVASLIQQQLGLILQTFELPTLATISKVEVSPDLKEGKVWLTIFTDEEKEEQAVLKFLQIKIYDIQGQLNRTLKMKIVPRIRFKVDHSEQYAAHINDLIKKTHAE